MTWTRFIGSEGRDTIFDLLVYMVWADGRLHPDELAGARAASEALGLADRELSGGLLGRAGRPFEAIPVSSLGPLERPFAYGVAAWMSVVDRRVGVAEQQALIRLRNALALPGDLALQIESWAAEERATARDAPEHRVELDRVMGRIVRFMLGDTEPRAAAHASRNPDEEWASDTRPC